MANGFTDLLEPNLPEHALWQLADLPKLDGLLFYLVFGLLAAIVSWINKRKEAAKLEQESHAAPRQQSQRPAPAQAGKPTGWLARLEQLAEAQLDKTDREPESHYDDDYEQESVETPMILPPVIGTTREAFRDIPLTRQLRAATKTGTARKTAPAHSPVYTSPIYSSNIAQQIASDIRVARQAVVASIILSQPRSLESPEQITRY